MRSKIVIMKPTSSGVGLIGVDSLLDVYEATQAGDLVTVYPGTYDIGDNSIQLKDGVNWKFIGNPTITSSSANGTFTDNNIQIVSNWEGKLTISNSNGLQSRIILSNSSSRIEGFYFRATLVVTISTTPADCSVLVLEDSLGADFTTVSFSTIGSWLLNFNNPFNFEKCMDAAFARDEDEGTMEIVKTFKNPSGFIRLAIVPASNQLELYLEDDGGSFEPGDLFKFNLDLKFRP